MIRDGATIAGAAEQRALIDLAAAAGLVLSDAQVKQLLDFLDLLEQWGSVYNLTSVRDRAAMRSQHLADCLAVVTPLARRAPGPRLLDVGSGGGLPGVVLAVARPDWRVTCVDAVAKKAAFVRQVAGRLGLSNLQVLHARVEAVRAGSFDVITARAFATLADLVRVSATLLAPGGIWMAMKGRHPADEIAALPASVEVFHVEPLTVPHLDAERCLVWMRRRETK